MEQADLIEKIETYIDRLTLLGLQKKIDENQIAEVSDKIIGLSVKYLALLNRNTEEKIQESEKVYAPTLESELQKRNEILAAVIEKKNVFEQLFLSVKDIKVAKKLQEYIVKAVSMQEKEVQQYREDISLVEMQMAEIKKAEALEQELQAEITEAAMKASALRNAQVSYDTLDKEILASYQEVLQKGNAENIDFQKISGEEKALKKRLHRDKENLDLAKTAEQAEQFLTRYQGKVNADKLALDEIAEKKFLYMLKKYMITPVDSYQSLENRSNTIQKLAQARMKEVENLYGEKVVTKEEYGTFATQINHNRIWNQLRDLIDIEKNDRLVAELQEKLKDTRSHIKGVEELEHIFAKSAEKRGRHAIVPEPPIKSVQDDVEILDDFEQEPTSLRKEVLGVKPASSSLMRAVRNMISKFGIKTELKKAKEPKNLYEPSIGDKIMLSDGAKIYRTPGNARLSVHGVNIRNIGLEEKELYVTRILVLDEQGNFMATSVDHGDGFDKMIESNNLPSEKEYTAAIGVSLGDLEGKFAEADPYEVNNLEKGWLMASDPHIIIVQELEKERGGMVK